MIDYLKIDGLHVQIGEKEILNGVDLTIPKGEVHAIMGPNGSGKSTLANTIMGHPDYTVNKGEILFEGTVLNELPADERARLGIFLSFQYPVALPGVSLLQLIKKSTSLLPGAIRYPTAKRFTRSMEEASRVAGIPEEMLSRSVNDGFSGGEKKKSEIIQMGMIGSRMILLDEIDSGLDIDALKGVSSVINSLRNGERSFLIITHYNRILSYIEPDRVHVMTAGRIIRSGDADLALELENEGYTDTDTGLEASS